MCAGIPVKPTTAQQTSNVKIQRVRHTLSSSEEGIRRWSRKTPRPSSRPSGAPGPHICGPTAPRNGVNIYFHVPPDPRFRLIQSIGLYDERLGERFHLVKEFERPWTQCGYAATKVEKQDFTAEAQSSQRREKYFAQSPLRIAAPGFRLSPE